MRCTVTGLARRMSLVALMAAVALLALSQVALAGSSPASSFTVYEKDKAGTAQQIGTWTYDATNQTLTGASFVQALTSTDYAGTALGYVPFSGQDAYTADTKMAVATKGFTIDDLANWVATQNGIPLGSDTSFNVTCSDTGGSYYYPSALTLAEVDDRYWYPSYNLSADPATATWDDSTRVARKAVLAILGASARRYQATPASPTTYTDLLTALGNLASSASDGISLELWMGQVKGDYTDANLGSNGARNVNSLTFMPAYQTITANVTGGAATVTTGDGYMKATASEPVTFTISDVESEYTVGSVSVTDADGASVAVTEAAGTYAFTMPSTAATINVALDGPPNLADAVIARIPRKVYTGSRIKPRLKVTYDGTTLVSGADYQVTYANNRRLGAATATITGLGTYAGTNAKTFYIIPRKPKLRRVGAGVDKATVVWRRLREAGGVSGFKVAYRVHGSSKYTSAGRTTGLRMVVRHLRSGVKYDFRVRAFKRIHGKRCYGNWSRVVKAIVK